MTLTRGFVRNAVTTPLDARLMDMAKVVCNADGSPRVGLLGANGASAVLTNGSVGPMTVSVVANEYVVSKGKADGVVILTNDGTVPVTITAAPGSNSRITSIWVKHNDDTTGDANALPVFGTTDGVAAASPVAPAIPTGALELAQLRVYSGTTASNGGSNTLTQRAPITAMRGGIVMARTSAELTAWTTAVDGQRARVIGAAASDPDYVFTGGVFALAQPADTGWTGLTPAAGWTNSGFLGYRVKNGICYLRGEVYGGADLSTLFTLPAGARPAARMTAPTGRFATSSTPPVGVLAINTTGVVTLLMASGNSVPGAAPGLTLGAISFPVD